MTPRYAAEGSPADRDENLKAPKPDGWVCPGRAWLQRDEDGRWDLALEPGATHPEHHHCASRSDAMRLAVSDERISEFYLWSVEDGEFLLFDRNEWLTPAEQPATE